MGKLSLAHLNHVTAASASVPRITDMVREKWGADYKLVGNDGLLIGDCSGTRGQIIIVLTLKS